LVPLAGGRERGQCGEVMALTIRPAEPDDAECVVAMIRALSRHDGEPNPGLTEEDFRRDGFGPERNFWTLIAELDGQPVGCAAYNRAYSLEWAAQGCYLLDLYVNESVRRHGVGRALVEAVCRAARERGASFLAWSMARSNVEATAFYNKLGAQTHDVVFWTASGDLFAELAEG